MQPHHGQASTSVSPRTVASTYPLPEEPRRTRIQIGQVGSLVLPHRIAVRTTPCGSNPNKLYPSCRVGRHRSYMSQINIGVTACGTFRLPYSDIGGAERETPLSASSEREKGIVTARVSMSITTIRMFGHLPRRTLNSFSEAYNGIWCRPRCERVRVLCSGSYPDHIGPT